MLFLYQVLSRNLKMARKIAGYSQEKTAELLGMSTLNYGRIERGERKASLNQLSRLAAIFECSVYELLSGCFPAEVSAEYRGKKRSVPEEKMAVLLASCTEDEQELCYEICSLMIYRRDGTSKKNRKI